MTAQGGMGLGPFAFGIERAEFCYVDRGLEPVVWDLNVYGHCANDDDERPAFPTGLMLWARGVPLPLSPCDDYSGFALHTPAASYRDSGQSYFALWAGGEYETWDIDLRIAQKKGPLYLLEFGAMTSYPLDGGCARLEIAAWAELLPPRTEPKPDHAVWLRTGLSSRASLTGGHAEDGRRR